MSSEALLENPALFSPEAVAQAEETLDGVATLASAERGGGDGDDDNGNDDDGEWRAAEAQAVAARQLSFAREYVALAERFPPRDGAATVKGHCFKMLHRLLEANHDARDALVRVGSGADVVGLLDELCARYALPTTQDVLAASGAAGGAAIGGGGGGGAGGFGFGAGGRPGRGKGGSQGSSSSTMMYQGMGGGGALSLSLEEVEAAAAAHVEALRAAPAEPHWQEERRRRHAAGKPIASISDRSWYRRHRR